NSLLHAWCRHVVLLDQCLSAHVEQPRQCPLLAQSGHRPDTTQCLLLTQSGHPGLARHLSTAKHKLLPRGAINGAIDMAEERVQSRLPAILAADVAGYSRLMGSDDEGTLADLKACRDLIALKSQEHRGRIVNTPGDAALVEFASAVDAARCAM